MFFLRMQKIPFSLKNTNFSVYSAGIWSHFHTMKTEVGRSHVHSMENVSSPCVHSIAVKFLILE